MGYLEVRLCSRQRRLATGNDIQKCYLQYGTLTLCGCLQCGQSTSGIMARLQLQRRDMKGQLQTVNHAVTLGRDMQKGHTGRVAPLQ